MSAAPRFLALEIDGPDDTTRGYACAMVLAPIQIDLEIPADRVLGTRVHAGIAARAKVEVDRILRGELFIDLYAVVRQALRIGVRSYSIKSLEPCYDFVRLVPLKDAGSSVVAYEEYIRSVTAGEPLLTILEQIRDYNQDDCRSNFELREWLEARRGELAGEIGEEVPRPGPKMEELARELTPDDRRRRELADRLRAAPASSPDALGLHLLADLLDAFYRANSSGLTPGQFGAAFFILTAIVPLLFITHGLMFWLLLRSPSQGSVSHNLLLSASG